MSPSWEDVLMKANKLTNKSWSGAGVGGGPLGKHCHHLSHLNTVGSAQLAPILADQLHQGDGISLAGKGDRARAWCISVRAVAGRVCV